MAKKQTEAQDAGGSTRGRKVILPNGEARVDWIRDRYYNAEGVFNAEDSNCTTRSDILKELNKFAGQEDVPYQIVFAATKTKERPKPKEVAAPAEEAEGEAAE